MVIYQGRSHRLRTGAKLHVACKKRKSRMGRVPIETKIGTSKKKVVRTRGGDFKIKAYSLDTVNVTDPKTNKTQPAKIKKMEKNNASIDYSRRSILTKGAIVETELGRVRITSRPGQTGILNGIILQ
jgi:small subunit ribosomal protein S8e